VIVLDASALLEILLQTPLGSRVESRLFRDGDEFHSPHLVDVEVAQGLRRLVRTGEVSRDRAADAIADLIEFDLNRHPHLDFLNRAWKWLENVTAYDAMYIALGEALYAPIVTCDAPFGRAPAHRSDCVTLFTREVVGPVQTASRRSPIDRLRERTNSTSGRGQ